LGHNSLGHLLRIIQHSQQELLGAHEFKFITNDQRELEPSGQLSQAGVAEGKEKSQ
jgi:hypothetical protein